MAKILIETTGQFELVDFSQKGLVVQADRPTVSSDDSSFISSRASIGQIRTLTTLSDEATDEEFENYWKESKTEVTLDANASEEEVAAARSEAVKKQKELAVAAFSEAYKVVLEPSEVTEQVEPVKKTRGKAQAE